MNDKTKSILILIVTVALIYSAVQIVKSTNKDIPKSNKEVIAEQIQSNLDKGRKAKEVEEEAKKVQEELDNEYNSLVFAQCYEEMKTATGMKFSSKKNKIDECYNRATQKNTGTVTPATSGVPQRQGQIVSNPTIDESQGNSKNSNEGKSNDQSPKNNGSPEDTPKTVGSSPKARTETRKSTDGNQNGKSIEKGGKIILRKGWNDPRVQYAYDTYGDMDFIKTIEAESKWDVNSIGDQGHSYGLCQIHNRYNKQMQKDYRNLGSDEEKIDFCYAQYKAWVDNGKIKTRLYGYNVRNLPQNKDSFTFLNK